MEIPYICSKKDMYFLNTVWIFLGFSSDLKVQWLNNPYMDIYFYTDVWMDDTQSVLILSLS